MRWAVKLGGIALGAILSLVFSVMMVLVFVQVINRYLLGLPLFWTEEVIRLLLVWSVLLALPMVTLRREEVSVELGPMAGKGLVRYRRIIVDGLSIVFLLFLFWQGYQFFLRNLPSMSPTLGLSRGWFVAPIPIGALLTVIATLCRPGRSDESGEPQ